MAAVSDSNTLEVEPADFERFWVGHLHGEPDIVVFDPEARPPAPGCVRAITVTPFEAPTWESMVYRAADIPSIGAPVVDRDVRSRAVGAYLRWRLAQSALAAEGGRYRPASGNDHRHTAVRAQVEGESLDRLRELVRRVLSPTDCGRSIVAPPMINTQDIELALCWYQGADLPQIRSQFRRPDGQRWLAEEHRQNKELARLLSARVAERSAARFFSVLGFDTVDVAATQRPGDRDGEWRRCDLRVRSPGPSGRADGEIALDVKNARRPFDNRGLSTRYDVPAFKRDRRGREVRIVGVLSPFQWADVLLGHPVKPGLWANAPVVVLGWTDVTRLSELVEVFDVRLLRTSAVASRVRSGRFLPAWAYDAPEELYGDWESAADTLRRELRANADARELLDQAVDSRIALAAALGVPSRETGADIPVSRWAADFFEQLRIVRRRFGRSLPALVLTLLRHFVEQVARADGADGEAERYSPAAYRSILWAWTERRGQNADDRAVRWWEETQREAIDPGIGQFPLGIYDPLRTVATLVDALETLWGANRGAIREYTAFSMTEWNILTAEHRGTGERRTVLAYCGGRDESWQCGNFPLVLGQNEHCVRGKLTCQRCGYCCQQCRSGTAIRRKSEPA